MSITEDLKNVSEAALGKLAAQFGDLPRPLLAAIGAGDVAVERLVRLRDQLGERWNEERDSAAAAAEEAGAENVGDGTDRDDAGSRLADATRRAQHIAEDVARRLSDVMGEVPDRAQRMIADLPAKAQEVANSLSRENLKETVESYTRRVGEVYRELADRGGERVHEAADKNATQKAGDRGAEESAPAKPVPIKSVGETAGTTPTARRSAASKPATPGEPAAAGESATPSTPVTPGEPATPSKPSTPGKPAAAGKPATPRPATPRPTSRKPGAGA